jgi:hypothetical protein
MSRPLRIGLIAEGEAELGKSVPYIKPEEGGKIIDRTQEGALHTLIRRELAEIGILDCDFVHRHPSTKERGVKLRTGHSITDPKYVSQLTIAWKPEEVDMILLLVDADDQLPQRQQAIAKALDRIRDNHLDANDQTIPDRSAGGVAIRTFETWLIADAETIAETLAVDFDSPDDLENVADPKAILETAIEQSAYLANPRNNQRPLQIRWQLAHHLNLAVIKQHCPDGYGAFIKVVNKAAEATKLVVPD